jgi:hypothetical protein
MATVTGYTAERMKEIEDKAIVSGTVVGGSLFLRPKNYPTEPEINAGSVVGPTGPTGPAGAVSELDLNTAITDLDTKLGNPLGVMNRMTGDYQVLTHNTNTMISFDDEDTWDNGGFHNLLTDNKKFTVPAGGKGIYAVSLNGYFSSIGSPGGTRLVGVLKNSINPNVGRVAATQVDYATGTTHVSMSIQDHFKLDAGDYLSVMAYHFTGATNQSFTANFCMRWVSDY